MKKIKAILFDFDGVIGKTMEDNYRAWKFAFLKYGININKLEYFSLEGMSTKKVVEYFLKENSKDMVFRDNILKLKENYYAQNNNFSVYRGVKQLLFILKRKGYLLGLVSGGIYERILKSLKDKFIKYFNIIITGENVSKCKPHPEPYLKAAKALSVKPSECIVIENAPLGIKAAKKAGMYCIAICSTLEKKHLQKADKIINNIIELQKIFSMEKRICI